MKVIGIGDNVVDRYVNEGIYYPGGNPVNFAYYAKMIGLKVSYLGVVGSDEEGTHIINTLQDIGVCMDRTRIMLGTVTERCDVNNIDGERIFIEDDYRNMIVDSLVLLDKDIQHLKNFDLIHCGCYGNLENELPKIDRKHSKVSFDFSCEPEYRSNENMGKICPYINYGIFSCDTLTDTEIDELAVKALSYGLEGVLITQGTKGQKFYDQSNFYLGKVNLVKAVDTMGAGDSFITVFVTTLLQNKFTNQLSAIDKKKIIDNSFEQASLFSSKICLMNGAFGHSKNIKGE